MRKIMFALIFVIIFLGCVSNTDNNSNAKVSIIKIYKGMITLGYDENLNVRKLNPFIIKKEKEYQLFIDMIPDFEMTSISPAPESNDPLLKKPEMDFTKEMILVIFSHDESRFIDCRIGAINIENNIMKVKTEYEDSRNAEIVQKIIDYGRYYAVVVPLFNGEVIFD